MEKELSNTTKNHTFNKKIAYSKNFTSIQYHKVYFRRKSFSNIAICKKKNKKHL